MGIRREVLGGREVGMRRRWEGEVREGEKGLLGDKFRVCRGGRGKGRERGVHLIFSFTPELITHNTVSFFSPSQSAFLILIVSLHHPHSLPSSPSQPPFITLTASPHHPHSLPSSPSQPALITLTASPHHPHSLLASHPKINCFNRRNTLL